MSPGSALPSFPQSVSLWCEQLCRVEGRSFSSYTVIFLPWESCRKCRLETFSDRYSAAGVAGRCLPLPYLTVSIPCPVVWRIANAVTWECKLFLSRAWHPTRRSAFLPVTGSVAEAGPARSTLAALPSAWPARPAFSSHRSNRNQEMLINHQIFAAPFFFLLPDLCWNAIWWTESSWNMSDGFVESKMLPLSGLICFLMLSWRFLLGVFFK